MDEEPENYEFATREEILAYLREHCDDIDSVVIPVQPGIDIAGPDGQRRRVMNVGAILKTCGGGRKAIHREDAAMLINDGVLQRLKIKCVLDPLEP